MELRIYNAAIVVAARLHSGVFDRSGMPYITHPLRVSQKEQLLYSVNSEVEEDIARAAAVLHDTIEDVTGVTKHTLFNSLERELTNGGPLSLDDRAALTRVVNLVEAVSKRPDEKGKKGYLRFIERILRFPDPIAEGIKRADIDDNMDPERLDRLPEKDSEYLESKYEAALEYMDGDDRP